MTKGILRGCKHLKWFCAEPKEVTVIVLVVSGTDQNRKEKRSFFQIVSLAEELRFYSRTNFDFRPINYFFPLIVPHKGTSTKVIAHLMQYYQKQRNK